MNYKVELADYLSDKWVQIAVIDKSLHELLTYLCIVKRMHPGSQVRAQDPLTGEIVVKV